METNIASGMFSHPCAAVRTNVSDNCLVDVLLKSFSIVSLLLQPMRGRFCIG